MNENGKHKAHDLWHLVNAIARVAGGGVCKRVTVVAYFDAAGNLIGREEIEVKKLFPENFFDILTKSN